jgi:cyclic beta-1,2-glucan synthetase
VSSRPPDDSAFDLEEPILGELFSIERLEQHAESLAVAQRVTKDPEKGRPLLSLVQDNGRRLLESYRAIAEAIREERPITPAAEWLVDNFHIVEDQLREIREDLPAGFYRELPKLADDHLQGYPRVFGLAWAFVAHTDSRFAPETLRRFVHAYQRVQPLTIGELWAVAITLRVVLVDNLRRLADRIVKGRAARQEADALADRLLGLESHPTEPLPLLLRQFERSPLPAAFAVQLVQRLGEQDPKVTPVLHWLDERLAAQGMTADEIVRVEHQRQAAMNVTVRNVITSMRLLSAVDWTEFFESVSLVDQILRTTTDFAAMDFTTRDRYRHAVEELSRWSGRSELEVASLAVARAHRAKADAGRSDTPSGDRPEDPGYYLISKGCLLFEKEIGFRVPLRRRMLRAYVRRATPAYLVTIAVVTAVLLALPLIHSARAGMGIAWFFPLALLALVPASDLALFLVNRGVTELLRPRPLPKLALREGVPQHLRTMVVVPMLLTRVGEVDKQIEGLEAHYLSNPDGEICFALLSDWTDAPTETTPQDEELFTAAVEGISRLNKRYGPMPGGGERFYLFHRRRVFNPGEDKWIGWERKRGKLHELNRLLRGVTDTSFLFPKGRPGAAPSGVRYVVTLDADTRLPRGAVRRLVGTMAHPLNRPMLDPRSGRVVEGYGVLQLRITPALPTDRENSIFGRIYSGPAGTDPYATAVSDVYQDLFEEGSYTGKGIYDVDAFEAALAGRVPENSLLSHDLFEGLFARAGFATDIELFEDFPSHYEVAASRQHRWARGDWQLLPWILGRTADDIPLIGRWKMLDNLRRTLSAPSALLTLVASWMLPLPLAATWIAFVLSTVALPALLPVLIEAMPRRSGISKRSHLRAVGADFALAALQVALTLTLLAHQAWIMADAIVRTLWRLTVTRRNLLEWVTAAQAKIGADLDPLGFYRRMSGGVAIAAAAGLLAASGPLRSLFIAAPFMLLWISSPLVARWISLPRSHARTEPLSSDHARILRLAARRTWRFFATFVGPETHGLPPDNFQEDPAPVLAHRTSPTNLGLYLLSTIAAHNFGWLGAIETVERLEITLGTMEALARFRGHFYNWYDTQTLLPLEPKYLSTVDSGNLAGHLIAVGHACREIIDRPLPGGHILRGIEDALHLVREAAQAISDDRRTQTVTRKQLEEALNALAGSLSSTPTTPTEWAGLLRELEARADTLLDIARTLTEERGDGPEAELRIWSEAVRATIASHARDLDLAIPWARLLDRAIIRDVPVTSLHDGGNAIEHLLASLPTPANAPGLYQDALSALTVARRLLTAEHPERIKSTNAVEALTVALERSAAMCRAVARRCSTLARTSAEMFETMDFSLLFDSTRKLFSIGYRVADGVLDSSYYDLLASEARLTSFIAIAKGDVPSSHWFRLDRALTPVNGEVALVSWSGSMFEYLMPLLVMRSPSGSLLDQTYRLVVRRQIQYGVERNVPWGISESAYSARDLSLTYQYSSFGVPGLGLKRGLSADIVVAPYATGLAAMVDPAASARNFQRIAEAGGCGPYGFYEALDYTSVRLPEGKRVAVVRAYMSHHQGMLLVAIANVLQHAAIRDRFHSDPIIQAVDLLLQERTPRDVAVTRFQGEEVARVREDIPPVLRRFRSPHSLTPQTHLLCNGRYAVMVTAAGSGYNRWRDLAVTRWREDATRDSWGTYLFIRDAQSGETWSAGYQPIGVEPDSYEAVFSEDRAEITRRDGTMVTALEVVVSPEDDAEVRRVTITNLGSHTREIEITSYAEIVLAPPSDEEAHPAFFNLFVQTEFVPELGALLATRRPRSSAESPVWAAHVSVAEGETIGGVQYETDRARFLGRGRGIRTPMSVLDGRPLSNTAGSVLDPIVSLRRRIRIPAGATARIVFSTLAASSRENALDLADKYRDPATFERVMTLAWTQAQVQLYHLGITPDEAHLFQRLAGRILYSDPSLRPSSEVLRRNARGPSRLWAHGISGDVPIILVRIDEMEDREIVRQLLRAHEYWRMKRLAVDLVILNEKPSSYGQDLQAFLEALVRTSQSTLRHEAHEAHGNVYVIRGDLITAEDRDLLQTAARAVLLSRHGTLAEQVMRTQRAEPDVGRQPRRLASAIPPIEIPAPRPHLEFFNGLGGFTLDGREYVTILGEGQWTPAPWINVIANPSFGFQVSESGGGYTWSVNSRENQLTPWSNDPVSDPPGETIYVRDEETGELWGPTVLPIREEAWPYVARHGQGYSRFEHSSHGISLGLLQFVPLDDPVKISRLTIENHSGRPRRLSVTAYAEWVLGVSRSASAPFIITELDTETGALLARNPWNAEFGSRVAFADLGGHQKAWTADRTEFLGRNGTLDHPAALERGNHLSGRVGTGLDPCAVFQATIELLAGERTEVIVLLGQSASREEARQLITRYRKADLDAELRRVENRWDDILGALQVRTPDPSMDMLLNRWLLYQALSCRVWGRTALYQASGAYGFRDQLQDVMALTVAKREIVREHLLQAASRQFVEGDVQHWWHPPSGRGVRTKISDDLLWLPYAVIHYLEVTGDLALLDELIPFLEGPALAQGESESYFEPAVSKQQGTLFEHCARALDRSLAAGSHELPLMGSGDWNDGMNRVGHEGKGESVWLGWFLHTVLWEFARIADERGESLRAEAWRAHVKALKAALEREAWDGDWYRRAYFDDGTPLGSATNTECRIDSIAQSWGVISGAADPARQRRAMAAVEEYLVRRGDGLVLLFTPPFDRTPLDPGYIKGYLPGIRENGGQYTHAAIWSVLAFAALGEGDKAGEIFSILNPINHASTRAGIYRYKVEPYVAAADIYSEPPHVGRGGWTWYTGSAGWMYRAGVEWILGFRLRGATLHLDPCIPRAWRYFEISFRYHSSRYELVVENPHGTTRGVSSAELDGTPLEEKVEIPLADDGATHRVRVILG